MFMPQSQPHHSRSYGAPSTVRRRGDKENAGALPSKTPSRNALKQVAGPSTGRMLGKATIDRNILAPKSDAPPPNDDIKPKRLFANVQPPASTTRPVKPRSVKTPAHAKTPAPYRDLEPEPQPTPLPSAQRTRRRSRNSLVRTPDHQWDQELSLDSIAEVELEPAAAPAVESDYELEYAPSPIKEVAYVPEWADSIPDPIETMTKLGQMRPMLFVAAPSPPKALQPVPMPTLDLCDDDEVEEPILRKAKPAPVAQKSKAALTSKPANRPLAIRGPSGAARPGAPAIRPTARAPATTRTAVAKPAPGSSATRPLASKTATSLRPGTTTKPPPTARSAPLGAARSTVTTRPAVAAARTASAPLKSGVRSVLSKTETRTTATRAAPAPSARKPTTVAPTSKPAARPGVKPGTATRPALASKTAVRPPAPAPAPTPSSPVPEFADMEMNFGVLDLDFSELEPKVQTPPAIDLGSELMDLPLPADEREQATKSAESESAPPSVVQASELPLSVELGQPITAEADIARPSAQDAPAHEAECLPVEAVYSQQSEQTAPIDAANVAERIAVGQAGTADKVVAVDEPAAADEPAIADEPVVAAEPGAADELVVFDEPAAAIESAAVDEPAAVDVDVDGPAFDPKEQPASGEPVTTDDTASDDFEAVDPALAPAVPSSNIAFDTIPEELEQELDLDVNALDISEDMSLESIQ
ncbi:hypothetical protein A1Q1_03410 [Trichosporon asahii var. asahii CBS 2479]|uniref:Uncharacterized protein n=1 Tax=Trichosporon asahii var. asahii (strain ATCC 90039 / CBS 2479 / JCM 2466 / KCTC 7840 / NBRC 103889/ NCYC 2677 / UAMH 7654) TaxID=1186058 RepID=J6ET38_TRIAS|nr:hypothetical protein A1Q1_03410 [Trichosporon asahii var. asahii CBS 2479]EJT47724.1 hypothetical protein A1Q1_03410 [Trichosporon asahii var. asahii CBS 2479]